MLTKKLLAAVGLVGALLLGVASDASAREWGYRPGFRPGPAGRGVDYRFHRGPGFGGPVYRGVDYRFHRGPGWERDRFREHGRYHW